MMITKTFQYEIKCDIIYTDRDQSMRLKMGSIDTMMDYICVHLHTWTSLVSYLDILGGVWFYDDLFLENKRHLLFAIAVFSVYAKRH